MTPRRFLPPTIALTLCIGAAAFACSSGDIAAAAATTTAVVPAAYKGFTSDVRVAVDGDFITLTATGIPNHKRPYFAPTDARFEAYTGTNASFAKAPSSIAETRYVMRIPLHPARAAAYRDTRARGPGRPHSRRVRRLARI